MPPHSRQSSSGGAPDRKSVLFCPSCGHESPVDGDWQEQVEERGLVYGCPACGEAVTVRADRGATESHVSSSSQTSPVSSSSHDSPAGDSLLARSVRLAFAWAAWPYTSAECTLHWTVALTDVPSVSTGEASASILTA